MQKTQQRTGGGQILVTLIGATVTGNRGAESMLRAALQLIPKYCPRTKFALLTLYPQDDAKEGLDLNCDLIPCKPIHLVCMLFPLSLLAGALRRAKLPYRFLLAVPALRAIHDSRLTIDLSGISFVDRRGLGILLYNALVILVPTLLGTPLMKYAQAMGPFETRLNRTSALKLLPLVRHIAARGQRTKEFLDELSLDPERISLCADAAFAMQVSPQADSKAKEIISRLKGSEQGIVCVSASSVVEELCRKRGVEYPRILSSFLQEIIDRRGYQVLLIAHSARPGKKSTKNNDLYVCEEVVRLTNRPQSCIFNDEAVNAECLRAMIGRCRFAVISRFHAMVSALAMKVPTMLVGWSHKYGEVLKSFELEEFTVDYGGITKDKLLALFDKLEREESAVRRLIEAHLPQVIESSEENARIAARILDTKEAAIDGHGTGR